MFYKINIVVKLIIETKICLFKIAFYLIINNFFMKKSFFINFREVMF